MTVAVINALLYSSRHPHEQLERALRIPALSPGWRSSFEALARSQDGHPGATGNAGSGACDRCDDGGARVSPAAGLADRS